MGGPRTYRLVHPRYRALDGIVQEQRRSRDDALDRGPLLGGETQRPVDRSAMGGGESKRRHGDGQSGAGERSRGVVIREGDANARNLARDVACDACISRLETRRASRGGAPVARAPRAASRRR